ncbi:MAG: hypothetical protein EB140_07445 [Proteobacteria bacterium]|nr:hypothetical protein [Pseudomonadota bacterium]
MGTLLVDGCVGADVGLPDTWPYSSSPVTQIVTNPPLSGDALRRASTRAATVKSGQRAAHFQEARWEVRRRRRRLRGVGR